jgi:hypothetical protein
MCHCILFGSDVSLSTTDKTLYLTANALLPVYLVGTKLYVTISLSSLPLPSSSSSPLCSLCTLVVVASTPVLRIKCVANHITSISTCYTFQQIRRTAINSIQSIFLPSLLASQHHCCRCVVWQRSPSCSSFMASKWPPTSGARRFRSRKRPTTKSKPFFRVRVLPRPRCVNYCFCIDVLCTIDD